MARPRTLPGQNIANPVAMVHSTAMLLDHLGAKHGDVKLDAGRTVACGKD